MNDSACANPILLGFLKNYLEDAKKFNPKGVPTFKRAYESMKACPIPFDHPSEATLLNGLGPKLVERLAADLEKHCRAKGIPMPPAPTKGNARRKRDVPGAADETETLDIVNQPPAAPTTKKRKTRPYKPADRSGAYALLKALYSEDGELNLTKDELIPLAQPHCDSNFRAAIGPGKFHTAWSSMKTLLEKELVFDIGNPKRYSLTEAGVEIARGLVEDGAGRRASVGALDERAGNLGRKEVGGRSSAESSNRGRQKENEPVTRRSAPRNGVMDEDGDDSFLGFRERMDAAAADAGEVNEVTVSRLRLQRMYKDAPLEYGAKRSMANANKEKEKTRASTSVEPEREKSRTLFGAGPIEELDLTASSPPPDIDRILSRDTSIPAPPPPQARNSKSSTSLPPVHNKATTSASSSTTAVFLKMLACIRGVSDEKALEIQRAFGTPRELVEAYQACESEEEMRQMVSRRCCEGAVGRKKIGKALSGKIAEIWAGVAAQERG
ncbi:Crossover junction endonuclease mus81 [Rhizina undulata]